MSTPLPAPSDKKLELLPPGATSLVPPDESTLHQLPAPPRHPEFPGDPTLAVVVGLIQRESERAIPMRGLDNLYEALREGRVVNVGGDLRQVVSRLDPNADGSLLTGVQGPGSNGKIYVGEIVPALPDCQGGGGTVAVILAQGPNGVLVVPASLAKQYVYAPHTQLPQQEGFGLPALLDAGAFVPFAPGSPQDKLLTNLTAASPLPAISPSAQPQTYPTTERRELSPRM